jgi:hypothetical protein
MERKATKICHFYKGSCLFITIFVYLCTPLLKLRSAKHNFQQYLNTNADVVELVDTLDLGSSAARCGGSSPFIRTIKASQVWGAF